MSPKNFFEKVSKSVSFFGLKSCCKGLWGKTPRCSLTIEYTFIRYVPCAEGNLKPSLTHYQLYKIANDKNITTDVIFAICNVLEVTPNDIMEYVPDE